MGKVWKLRDAGHFKCKICHKEHDPRKRTFIMIAGNIMVGIDGGLVGHNFDGDPTKPDMHPVLKKVTVLCFECWDKFNEECIRACIELAQRGVHMPPDCPICEQQVKHPFRKLNIEGSG